jgi:signal transduction histidine kinase
LFNVEDTGIGIKYQDLSKLFKLFGKLEDKDKLNKGGCGLGLSICKSIVQQLGGKIEVQSIEGFGSSFSFNIFCMAKEEGNNFNLANITSHD